MCYLLVLALAVAASGEEPAKKKAKPAPSPTASATTIPKDAVRISPKAWRWVDKDGKAWRYEQTPFGVMKGEEKPEVNPAEPPEGLQVFEDGDSLRFERPWPFGGSMKWSRKKSELTEMEQEAWRRAREKKAQEASK
jgi:hypothetical protein